MYMALMPGEFSRDELRRAWDYYEPKTLHDSTLSYGIHALLAARLGLEDRAVSYFEKSLFLDLRDVMSNTGSEGVHTASWGPPGRRWCSASAASRSAAAGGVRARICPPA